MRWNWIVEAVARQNIWRRRLEMPFPPNVGDVLGESELRFRIKAVASDEANGNQRFLIDAELISATPQENTLVESGWRLVAE